MSAEAGAPVRARSRIRRGPAGWSWRARSSPTTCGRPGSTCCSCCSASSRSARRTSPPTRSDPSARRRAAVPSIFLKPFLIGQDPIPPFVALVGFIVPVLGHRVRVRRDQRRALRGDAAAPRVPADLPRRRHQRQVRGRARGHRPDPRRRHGAGRRRHDHPARHRADAPRTSVRLARLARRSPSCTSGSGWRSRRSARWRSGGRRRRCSSRSGCGSWRRCSRRCSRRSRPGVLAPGAGRRDDGAGRRERADERHAVAVRAADALLGGDPGHPRPVGAHDELARCSQQQVDRAIPSALPLDQSLLLVWVQLVAIVALTVGSFALAYVLFMRQEVRA